MATSTTAGLAAALLLALAPAALAETSPGDLPAAVAPAKIAGSGLNVIDLEARRAGQVSMLGMSVTATYRRDGAPFEYLVKRNVPGAILALSEAPRPPGPNGFGRVILETPDAKALGQPLAGRGVPMREVVAGVAYFITDPEGNAIELYTPPRP